MEKDSIQITLWLNGSGTSNSLDSALARPFRRLIREGKLIGKINYIFYEDSVTRVILGSLCYSSSGRIIFFPGITERKIVWESDMAKLEGHGPLDHITIEPDLKTWHLTSLTDEKKDASWFYPRSPQNVEPNLDYWFGMSVTSPNIFEPEPKEYQLSFEIPQEKSPKECADILMQARDGSVFHTLSLVDKNPIMAGEFLHFDFLLDRRPRRASVDFPSNVIFIPTGPPSLKTRLHDSVDVQPQMLTRRHSVGPLAHKY